MAFQPDLENALSGALSRYLDKSTPSNLSESIRYSLLAPGKRIRPRLLLACGKMMKLPDNVALSAAIALEMIHCFTLIHDDLPCMDNDDLRRGQPTNHKKFGEGLALLAGDALISVAYDVFSETADFTEPKNFLFALQRFNHCIGPRGVIGGQAQEMILNESSTLADLREMHAKKTGALFSASLLIPKDLAGVSDDSPEGLAIDIFGKELGLAFQVLDDLEDAAEGITPHHILHYLPLVEAKSMTLQRLNAAALSLSSTWETGSQPLVQIAEEVSKKIEAIESVEISPS